MKALTSLIPSISNQFDMHHARKKTLSAILFGMINSGNVQQLSFSAYLESARPKAALRRVERFFQHQTIQMCDSARAIVNMLDFKGKFDLCLDRTNWKFGEKNVNYLVLSWRLNKSMSVPLFAYELDKAGNSNTEERIELLEDFNSVFGFDRINSLYADREFIGKNWLSKLVSLDAPFYIRVKDNGRLPYGDSDIRMSKLFEHLCPNEYRVIEKEMYGTLVRFAGTRSSRGDLVIVITNQNLKPRTILSRYRKRWSIEEMFKSLKSSGFNWENTHMIQSSRLITLLAIMSIAAVMMLSLGIGEKAPYKKTLKCPLWTTFKRGAIRFRYDAAKSLDKAIDKAIKALNFLKKLLGCQK